MTCQEFWDEMPELQAEAERVDHALNCPACAGLLADQAGLVTGLRRMAQDGGEAPPRVEARLVSAFRAQAGLTPAKPVRARTAAWWAWVPAAAVLVAVALFLARGRQPEPLPQPDVATVETAGEEPVADSDFIPLPYATDSAPGEESDLVRLKVPRSALIALGLPVAMDGGTGPVEAVVAVNADGVMEGVRLVQ